MAERTEPTDTVTGIIELEAESEFDNLMTSEDRVLVDFYADWCGPCQMMEPTMEAISKTVDAPVVKVDTDTFPQIAARFDVSSIPTVIGFDQEVPAGRLIGMQDAEAIRQLVD
ncbi:thioredoxin family protein [Natrinema salaciae]|uniref:Thioredoxin n=1 Tax=Natrinema salaciae TaxID=1186196 RepID=A0A1H9P1S4_9EURY|nr:thioredoxin family protein [Natrinema salaciae]SER41769.1 thioredoxin [Natrinema salaciae]